MSSEDNIASDATLAATTERYCPGCDHSFPATLDRCPTDGTDLIELADDDSLIGVEIDGRFTIKRKLGSGGMGAAYAAVQHSIDRQVAIKVIHTHLSRDRQSAKRFLRETKLASKLSHPNTVTVLDFGQTPDRRLYMVMELVGGHTLATVLEREGRLDPVRAINIGMQVCDAVSAAHELQIVHRDLKPSNIMLEVGASGRDFIRVLDFGLAKSLGGDETTVTESNAIMGTPQYIPPELAVGRAADGRADLYSLGAVLYELVAGRPIFAGDTIQAVLFKQVHEPPPPLPDDVPAPLVAVIMKLLAKKPENRFQTAGEVHAALEAVREGRDPGVGRPRDADALAVTIDPGSARVIAVTEGVTETVDSKWELEAPSDEVVAAAVRRAEGEVRAVATEVAGAGPATVPRGARVAWVLVPVVVAAAALLMVQKRASEDPESLGVNSSATTVDSPHDAANDPGAAIRDKEHKDGDIASGAGGRATGSANGSGADNKQPPATTVTIKFSSTPDGAKVVLGKETLCTTPCQHDLDRSNEPVKLRFVRRGFRTFQTTMTPDKNQDVSLELQPRREPTRRPDTSVPNVQDVQKGGPPADQTQIGDFEEAYSE